MSLNDLFTEIILDHYQHPHNHGTISNPTASSRGYNESCGDEVFISLTTKDGIVEDIKFTGAGCSISQASASILTDLVKGKSITEVRALADKFYNLVRDINAPEDEQLGDAVALKGVARFPARVKCATMPWHTLEECFKQVDGK
jgi:nitrogen fixation NifU-like protein